MSEAQVTRKARRGMIALRGDLTSEALRSVCTRVTGVTFPEALRGQVADDKGLAWMSPDEVLVMVPHTAMRTALSDINAALQGTHFAAENVSDARAILHVTGRAAREVMAKNTPVDLHHDSFGPGHFRRSMLGQVAAAFWMDADRSVHVICFASVADYVEELLQTSAEMGSVDYF